MFRFLHARKNGAGIASRLRANRFPRRPSLRASALQVSREQTRLHDNVDQSRPAFERGLAIARRNWVLLLICIVIVPVAAFVYSRVQTTEYTASASLLFGGAQNLTTQLLGVSPAETDPARAAATNLRLVSVEQVAANTAKALNKPGLTVKAVGEKISVSPEGESDLVSVKATDPDPQFAARLANEFAGQYITYSRDAEGTKIRQAQELLKSKLSELTSAERNGPAGEDLRSRERQLSTLAALQTGNAQLAQPATTPTSPSSPKTTRNVALGILLGILLGGAFALLREHFDRRIRDFDDLRNVYDLPIIGTIPESPELLKKGPGADLAPGGAEGEAFRMLRASLRYFNVDRELTSVLITSAAPQDGKTTVAWNLALAEAQADNKVLHIEGDLRRPTLGGELHVGYEDGLSLVLAGVRDPTDAIHNVHGVDVLFAGPLPPNPAELIESDRMTVLLRWAEDHYDRVIIDTPPAAVVADAISLFHQVSGVVIVARLLRSSRDGANDLREHLSQAGAPVLGVVVNGVPAPPETGYYKSNQPTRAFSEAVSSADGEFAATPTPSTSQRDQKSRASRPEERR